MYREVRLRPDDRFGKAIASHGGAGGFDVRGLRRGSEPLTPHSGATDDLRTALQSRDRESSSAGPGSSSGGGGAVLRRGFSEPKMDGPEALGQIDTRDYKHDIRYAFYVLSCGSTPTNIMKYKRKMFNFAFFLCSCSFLSVRRLQ